MPSSFVYADRLKFWEIIITMEITEMGFLKFATIYGHIGSSGMTHINKAQMTPTNFKSWLKLRLQPQIYKITYS